MLRSSGTCFRSSRIARYAVADPLRYGIPDANHRTPVQAGLPTGPAATTVAQLHHRTAIVRVIPRSTAGGAAATPRRD